MEQEERIIPAEILNELLRLDADNPITANTLYSDDDDIRQKAEDSVQVMRNFLENSGLSADECEEYIYKVQRRNELLREAEGVKDEFLKMGCSVLAGIIIMVISAIVAYLLYRYNMSLYNDKNTIWYFAIFINMIVAAIGVIAFLYLIVKAIGGGLFNVGQLLFKKNKKPNNDYMEYANYLMENHNYSKEAVILYFSDYDMDNVEFKAFIDKIKES